MELITDYLDGMLVEAGIDLWENDNNYNNNLEEYKTDNLVFDALDVPLSNAHSSVLNTTQKKGLWN